MRALIDKQAIEKVYGRWAPIYDLVFGAIFERGRRAAIAASEHIGGRILEAGVGTGISDSFLQLPAFGARLCASPGSDKRK